MADLSLADVRAKFPQYKDLSDDELVQGLHQKFYSDMPYADFSAKVGLNTRPRTLADNISDVPGLGEAAAAGEILTQGATGLVGKAAGGVGGLLTMAGNKLGITDADPAANVEATQRAMTYQPRTPLAQSTERQLGAAVQPMADAADKGLSAAGQFVGGDTGENIARTVVPAAAEAALTLAPGVKGLTAIRGARAADALPAAVEGAAKPVVGTGQAAIETGRAARFKFTPGAVESRQPGADVPNTFAVSPTDRRDINLHNQARATELAGNDIGLQNAKTLPTKAFEDAKQPHIQTYRDTGNVLGSGLTGSPDLVSSLEAQVADTSPKTALPGPVAQQANRILNAAKSGNLSGPQMVSDISWLRANGGRSVANTLETEMETQLAKTPAGAQQLGAFRDARTSLAQINDLQRAAAKGGGQISLPHLVAVDAKNPNLLTGTPKLLAQTAAAAPQDFRLPSGVVPGSSPISKPTLTGAALSAAKWVAKKTVPSKFDVQSDAFQNRFGRVAGPAEQSYFKDLGKRPAAPSRPFELANAPGSTGVRPAQRGMTLPQGPEPAPGIELAHPEGTVGVEPQQLGFQLAAGRPAAPGIELAAPEGALGEPPSRQLGMEISQGRPLEDQKLGLKPTEGSLEPHQPSLLGHEGTPEGGSRKPKGKKRGKD